jgi:hypothetical protein
MPRTYCTGITRAGNPCRGFAVSDAGYCQAHDPARADAHREAMRKGGEARSAVRRAARLWASRGEQIEPTALPAMLRATMVDVRAGIVEPGVAQALAALAKASVALSHDLELDARLTALERVAGITPPNVTHLNRRTG